MKSIHFTGPDGNGGASNADVADRFAEEDAERAEWLKRHTHAPCPTCGQPGRHHPKCADGNAARGRRVRERGRRPRMVCTVPGCSRIEKQAGLCNGHLRQRDRGRPFSALRSYRKAST